VWRRGREPPGPAAGRCPRHAKRGGPPRHGCRGPGASTCHSRARHGVPATPPPNAAWMPPRGHGCPHRSLLRPPMRHGCRQLRSRGTPRARSDIRVMLRAEALLSKASRPQHNDRSIGPQHVGCHGFIPLRRRRMPIGGIQGVHAKAKWGGDQAGPPGRPPRAAQPFFDWAGLQVKRRGTFSACFVSHGSFWLWATTLDGQINRPSLQTPRTTGFTYRLACA